MIFCDKLARLDTSSREGCRMKEFEIWLNMANYKEKLVDTEKELLIALMQFHILTMIY